MKILFLQSICNPFHGCWLLNHVIYIKLRKIIVAPQLGNYSSFYYIRETLMRKLFENFKVLQFQERIVATSTI